MKAIIDIRHLKAALHAASTEGTRYYLNGVLLEIGARESFSVATDGHILVALHHDLLKDEEEENTLRGFFIVPTAAVKQLKAGVGCGTIEKIAENTYKITGANEVIFTPVDGTFPDWRRVVPSTNFTRWRPTEKKPQPWQFNPALLVRLQKAMKELGSKNPLPMICHAADGAPAPVPMGEDGFGIVMPMRGDPEWTVPAWLNSKDEGAAKAA